MNDQYLRYAFYISVAAQIVFWLLLLVVLPLQMSLKKEKQKKKKWDSLIEKYRVERMKLITLRAAKAMVDENGEEGIDIAIQAFRERVKCAIADLRAEAVKQQIYISFPGEHKI